MQREKGGAKENAPTEHTGPRPGWRKPLPQKWHLSWNVKGEVWALGEGGEENLEHFRLRYEPGPRTSDGKMSAGLAESQGSETPESEAGGEAGGGGSRQACWGLLIMLQICIFIQEPGWVWGWQCDGAPTRCPWDDHSSCRLKNNLKRTENGYG